MRLASPALFPPDPAMRHPAFQVFLVAALVLCLPRLFAETARTRFPEALPPWLASIVLGSAPVQTTGLEFDTLVFDFGTVLEGEEILRDFPFVNATQVPVRIESARKSCGCSRSDYPRTPVAPGATGKVTFVLETMNRSGRQSKKLVIRTDEEGDKKAVLLLRGLVESPVLVDLGRDENNRPLRSLQHRGWPGEVFEHEAELVVDERCEDLNVKTEGDSFLAARIEGSGSTRTLHLVTTVPQTMENQKARAHVHCCFEGQDWSRSVLVSLDVRVPVTLLTKKLRLRQGQGTILLKIDRPDTRITRIETSTPDLVVTEKFAAARGVGSFQYRVQLREGAVLPDGAWIRMETNAASVPFFEIPVSLSP